MGSRSVLPFRRGVASVSREATAGREEHQMTRQNSFKRLVRARMEKTGQSYTVGATVGAGRREGEGIRAAGPHDVRRGDPAQDGARVGGVVRRA